MINEPCVAYVSSNISPKTWIVKCLLLWSTGLLNEIFISDLKLKNREIQFIIGLRIVKKENPSYKLLQYHLYYTIQINENNGH